MMQLPSTTKSLKLSIGFLGSISNRTLSITITLLSKRNLSPEPTQIFTWYITSHYIINHHQIPHKQEKFPKIGSANQSVQFGSIESNLRFSGVWLVLGVLDYFRRVDQKFEVLVQINEPIIMLKSVQVNWQKKTLK